MDLIDHIGNQVTVWTEEGNSLSARTLITADEMGIVVSPWVGDANQNKEVFIPWCKVKYVDLLKPSASMIQPIKPPSPEFIEKAKEIIETLKGECDGGELKKESDSPRAKVGDVVRYCEGIKHVEPLLSQRNEEYTVKRVDDYRVHVDWPSGVFGPIETEHMIIPHGWYTIVRHADEDDTSVKRDGDGEITEAEAKEIIERAKNGELDCEESKEVTCIYCGQPIEPMKDDLLHSEGVSFTRDESWHEWCKKNQLLVIDPNREPSTAAECDGEKEYSTRELVEILKKREAVDEYDVPTNEHICRIQITDNPHTPWKTIGMLQGPARIFTVLE